MTEGLGQLLAKHRKSLPDFKVYTRRARVREQEIAEVGVRRLRYREEARRIADLDQTVAELEVEMTAEKTPQLRDKLRATDSFRYTLRTLVLTLIIAAPMPLLFATVGWELQLAQQGTDLSHAIGYTLLRVALHLLILRTLSTMCIPHGLAAAHFRRSESNLQLLRAELARLTWIFVPAVLVVRLAVDLNPVETGGTIARLGFLIGYTALTFFLYRVFRPQRGVLAYLRTRRQMGLLFGSYCIWFPLLLAFPLGLAVLALAGFMYSAAALSFMFQYTLWLVVGLILVHALSIRWLLVVRRRLAYEAAMERRQASLAARQAVSWTRGAKRTIPCSSRSRRWISMH